jgi:catechol 2,3-dioxygenase-like lactoylglutathione lyase family enzyme
MSSTSSPQTQPPPILGIDHLKLPTNSLPAKLAFYTSILPFTHLTQFDHRHADSNELFAVILQHPQTELLLELRLHPAQAAAQKGWDAITWSVETRADLETWRAWLVAHDVECSRVLKGFKGWVLVAEDPDRAMVRWYCKETHEWDSNVDSGELYVRQSRGSFFINGWPQIRGGLDSEAEANSTANPS